MTDDKIDLRLVMRSWASGVAVVTAAHEGLQHGMTVNSFTSVSLDPPRILVSLEKTTRTHQLAILSGHFGITILAADQVDISDRFAGRIPAFNENRFEGLELETLTSGSPFIKGGLAYLDCAIVQPFDVGANTLLIAEVTALLPKRKDDPLLYLNRDYRRLK